MSKQHLYPYSILSTSGNIYTPQNFTLPSGCTADEGLCLMTSKNCTLLQKLLRYRSDGPVFLQEQQLSDSELAKIHVLRAGDQGQSVSIPLTSVVPASREWKPAVRWIRHLSATFLTREACEQARQDIERYHCFPVGLRMRVRQEYRKPMSQFAEARCTCHLTSIYQDVVFYAHRESCPRHQDLIENEGRLRTDFQELDTSAKREQDETHAPVAPVVQSILPVLLAI